MVTGIGKWITEFGEFKIDAVREAWNFLARYGVGEGAAGPPGRMSESRHQDRNVPNGT